MAVVCLVGSTGLVGSNILAVLQKVDGVGSIIAFARKELPTNQKLRTIVSSDSTSWPRQYPAGNQLFISALGTTRATAGGFDNQKKIDYDLNLELAKAAKAAGTTTYVLISSSGANSSSYSGYLKMKGDLEEAVKALDFDHTVIVRPGLLVGQRNESRLAEGILRNIATVAGKISGNRLKDFWAQDADVIAKAAVKAGLDCVEGKSQEKVRLITQSDIIRLGRTEWRSD
ncbi:hypothetical protein M433DRAFT_67590 [Acidomyces richmondensis BFW]|nr:MAG: hypothetical protein FE78DRAFT_146413 [Acidomyces sp. 'richmondensis']KYG45314.1 hypothetical protein M433DRAFT_67590 [Acidomyces richmondensis BFW]